MKVIINGFSFRCDDEINNLQRMRIRNKGRAAKFDTPLHPTAFNSQFFKSLFNRGYKTSYNYEPKTNNIVTAICKALVTYNKHNLGKDDNKALYKRVFIEVFDKGGKTLVKFPLSAIKLNKKGTRVYKTTFSQIVANVKSNPYLDKETPNFNFEHRK